MKNFLKIICAGMIIFITQIAVGQGGATTCSIMQSNFQAFQSCATDVPFTNQTASNSESYRPSCFNQPLQAPTWFYIKIKNTGVVDLQISQVSNLGNPIDVDFCLWGPFTNLSGTICSSLSAATEADCSWSGAAVEPVTIQDAVQGQFYILVVDNFVKVPGTIRISQVGGSGSSDCSFLSSVKIRDTANDEIRQYNYCKPATKDLMAVINVADFTGNLADLRFNYRWSRDGVVVANVNNSALNTNVYSANQTGLFKVEIAVYDVTNPSVNINNVPFLPDQTAEIDLKFFEKPSLNTTTTTANLCDLTAPNNDGITATNLTQFYNSITNNTPNISLRFYRDSALTQQISNPSDFTNTTANNQTIYVVGDVTGQPFYCPSNVATLQLVISPTSLEAYADVVPVCPILNLNYSTIDFDAQRQRIKNTFFPTSNVNIQFYTNQNDASLEQNQLTNVSQIAVGTSTIFTKIKSGVNCNNIGTFLVRVKSAPFLSVITNVNICRNDILLLQTKDIEATTGQSSTIQVSYHISQSDAENNVNQISKSVSFNGSIGQNSIFVRLFDSATQCYSTVRFVVVVYQNPSVNQNPEPYAVCGTTTGIFDLQSRISYLVGTNNYSVLFFETQLDLANNNPIVNSATYTTVPRTIIAQATDAANNSCKSQTNLQLVVNQRPGSNTNPLPFLKCNSAGFDTFDLRTSEPQMAGNTPLNSIVFRYYINRLDATTNSNNTIVDAQNFQNTVKNYQKIFVRINNVDPALFCFSILEQEIFVGAFPPNNLNKIPYYICKDANNVVIQEAVIDTKLAPQNYVFQWFINHGAVIGNEIIGETSAMFSTAVNGLFSVKITDTSVQTNCITVANFETRTIVTPQNITISPDEIIAFAQANVVSIDVTPVSNEYEYQLNFGPWQSSNILSDLKAGQNTVQVRNKNGCDEISKKIIVANYKTFFTPNGDSFNDFWKIDGDVALDIIKTMIFDRFGQLIYEHNKSSQGWDGNFRGQPMPADDYWFKIEYTNQGSQAEFRGHFALKR